MSGTFFITTAIDYTNGAPHIGHAYEKVLADVLVRYQRLKTGKKESAFLLTGVDQHGQKVQQSAEKQGVEPQQFVDETTAKFRALWEKLDVRYDRWAATTDPLHKECVRKILQKLWDEGKIYKDKQGGYYSVRQEQFLTDKERGPDGEFGPEWGEVEFREEENFYFRLKDHKQWLLALIDKRHSKPGTGCNGCDATARLSKREPESETAADSRPLVVPEFRAAELRNAVEKIEGDLCISRPASRLKWGIPFPETFGSGFVTYVWFDALVNYISFAGYDPEEDWETRRHGDTEMVVSASPHLPVSASSFHSLWPALHIIGKDILIPAHGIYWVIMLHALGFPDDQIPSFLVHGWWNISGAKMSKSTGNIADPDALADKYGPEALRYYLMSDIATGKDSDFSEERLIQRYNVDLANNLGNLLNRTLNMAQKYREGRIRRLADIDQAFVQSADWPKALAVFTNQCDEFSISTALDVPCGFAVLCNVFIETQKPWSLAKDPTKAENLDAVLYFLAESLRIIAILISPVLPKAALAIFDQLDPEKKLSRDFQLKDAAWGKLPDGHIVGRPVPLFPRIEPPAAG